MNEKFKELKERISALSDDELVTMVHVDFTEYRKEAIEIAKEEMKIRGILDEIKQDDFQYLEDETTHEIISEIIRRKKLKKHVFVETIVKMSQKIKKLKKDSDNFLFLIYAINEATAKIELHGLRDNILEQNKLEVDYGTVATLSEIFGLLGILLSNKIIASNHKIESIDGIISTMVYRLCTKLSDEELAKREKLPFSERWSELGREQKEGGEVLRECKKKFQKMLYTWLNAELLVITNARDLNKAWNKLLKDSELTEMDFNNLETSLNQRLMRGKK